MVCSARARLLCCACRAKRCRTFSGIRDPSARWDPANHSGPSHPLALAGQGYPAAELQPEQEPWLSEFVSAVAPFRPSPSRSLLNRASAVTDAVNQAAAALLQSEAIYTAVAACWAKEGASMLSDFREKLIEQYQPENQGYNDG